MFGKHKGNLDFDFSLQSSWLFAQTINNNMKFFLKPQQLLLLSFLLISNALWAQTGKLNGVIIDPEWNNEPIPYVSIKVNNSTLFASDEVGNFSIDLAEGQYLVEFSSVGYQNQQKTIDIRGNNTVNLKIELQSDSQMLDDIEFTVSSDKSKETALLLEQKQAVQMKQAIGTQELSRKGVGDVASAVAKTSGISKQEGSNNVFVRGLGDRYNSTSMNGLPIPSNDPEKKNIALDHFSTDIVEYIAIDKVYNSKISGDFGGGNVDIASKNYNGNGLLELQMGSKVNTNALNNFNNFTLQDGPSFNGFGKTNIPNKATQGFYFSNKLQRDTKTPINGNFGIKAGKSYSIGKEGKLSLFATAAFDNGYEYRKGLNQSLNAQGVPLKSFQQEKFNYKTNTTGMFNGNYRINDRNKVGYNFLFINSSEQTVDNFAGYIRDIAEDDNGLIQRGTYIQNKVLINQLLGEHQISDRTKIEWASSLNTVKGFMPDRTQNTLKYLANQDGYVFAQNTITDNHRYFQELNENEFAVNIAAHHELSDQSKLSIGYNGRFKERNFEAVQFNFRIRGSQLTQVVDPKNLDTFFNQENYNNNYFGIETFTGSAIIPQTYQGIQNIHAGYAQITHQFSDRLSALFGLRFDRIEQEVQWKTQLNSEGDKNTFERNEWLPNLTLKYAINEKQNLRFGASKTYTLPQFKERALFIYEDVTEVKVGNPDLYPSQNYNMDIKWEMFPSTEEIFSITAFGKYIQDPINEITLASATNDISWVNIADFGYVYGVEWEARKNLFKTEGDYNQKLSLGINVSWMQTKQEIDSEKIRKETNGRLNINITDDTSKFTGASDLLLNTDLSYTKNWSDTSNMTVTIAYSHYSDRLYALGTEGKGNLVDKGMGTLDLIIKTRINNKIGFDFGARNLLNPTFKRVQENVTGHHDAITYKRGSQLGIGMTYTF